MTDQTPLEQAEAFLELEQFQRDGLPVAKAWTADHGSRHLTYGTVRALVAQIELDAGRLDQLRRQLDAAEAAPCGHEGTAFDALEQLHSRIHRDFNFDANECAPPTEDEIALRMMDDLVTYADELYMPLANATRGATTVQDDPQPHAERVAHQFEGDGTTHPENGPQRPAGDVETDKYPPHTVTVTKLAPGFDHQDRREHEYVVGNDVVGWTSHQVTHPDACHRLPYGRACWLDEAWYQGPYRYDEIEPGRYEATWVSEMVGDHRGEFSHMDEYVHYERTGDVGIAPEDEGIATADTRAYCHDCGHPETNCACG